ncbi:uncharacterized SAM-binding protein YcdF (DUF218 family) [Mycobacterium frederiksbergense]|uniref:Uncharacterized SAM-binding protein YcdF (DUF218 family) n=1 Tax=Mycolicibacterium frederiksbergense TaxID=117567 RepID=A0ABT6L1S1_9MYCO|nr:YdcF family protein [Mycolicibacterium frederiksbergense]MDH6196225.1 uncharacterized SAM-binding protein YcdF (DUF218 family) [Mycolicibacterium frederiksbergense]
MADDRLHPHRRNRTPGITAADRSEDASDLARPLARWRDFATVHNRILSRGGFRRRRWISRFIATACLLLTAALIGGLPVYLQPQIDPVRHADAIFVLGGYGDQRYTYGLELAKQGWAPKLVVSNPRGKDDPWLTEYCATQHTGFDLNCFAPDPATTKGEGRELRQLASQFAWRTVIVVTFRPHISRARFILERCFDGDLVMATPSDQFSAGRWAIEYGYQTAGYARAVLEPGC